MYYRVLVLASKYQKSLKATMRLTLGIGKENARRNQTFFLFLSSIFFNRLLKKFPLLLKIFPITIAWRCSGKKTHFSRSSMLISKPYSFIHISSWKHISVKIREQLTDFLTRRREKDQILNSEFLYLFYKNFEIISSICSSEKQSSNFISKSF